MPFRLTPPKQITLLISMGLAMLAVASRYSGYPIPVVRGHTFVILLIGYLVLLVGNLIETL